MHFFIGIVPRDDIAEKISNIQNKFGNNRLEPHITLRPPIALKEKGKWLEVIQDTCKGFFPFTIHLTGTGNFGKNVLFIKVQSDELLTLQRQLVRAIKPYEPESQRHKAQEYHPHLTLGRSWCGFTKDDFAQMKILVDEYLAKQTISFLADSVRIYHKPKGNEGYRTFKNVAFKRDDIDGKNFSR